MTNDFKSLDAQQPESAFAKMTPEELNDYNDWLDEKETEFMRLTSGQPE